MSSASSASNTLRILEILQRNPSLRVVDVARSLDCADSTAHRLLSCLKDHGFVRQASQSRNYVAGPELLRLSRHFSDQNTLERVAHPHLKALCKEINEAVNLQVLIGAEVLCVDSIVEDRHTLQVHHITGQRVAANVSAAGKMLLSALEPDELEDLLYSLEPQLKPGSSERSDLEDELDAVRARGYATNIGEREPGVHAVAVPVLDKEGMPTAALAIAAPSNRLPYIRIARLVHHLQLASSAIKNDYYATM